MKYMTTLITARMMVVANVTRSPSARDSLMRPSPVVIVINRNLSRVESQDERASRVFAQHDLRWRDAVRSRRWCGAHAADVIGQRDGLAVTRRDFDRMHEGLAACPGNVESGAGLLDVIVIIAIAAAASRRIHFQD